MFGLEKKELKILRQLNTPAKIQNFLNRMPMNFEKKGETNLSPMSVLEKKTCHCTEGAALAALALRVQGYPPLVLDLTANKNDFDHVVAVYQKDGRWGAISKTNHAALRYREPIYNSLRELAMSYFHEYLDNRGRKNLRSFSPAVNLKRFDKLGWMTTKEEIDYIPEYLVEVKHFPILNQKQIRNLRKAEPIEIEAGKITEWKPEKGKNNPSSGKNKRYYLYILKCRDKTLYTGITVDLIRRIREHNSSQLGSKYTAARRPVRLVYAKKFRNRSAASKEEYRIKRLSKKEKSELILFRFSFAQKKSGRKEKRPPSS